MAGIDMVPGETFVDSFEGCRLEAVVPRSSTLDARTLAARTLRLERPRGQSEPPLPQRASLYLDEDTTVYIVFQTPYLDETAFRDLLARAELTLETFAVGSPRRQQGEAAAQVTVKDLVDTRTFGGSLDPVISVTRPEEDNEDGKGAVIVAWKTSIHISRPRIRSTNSSVYFAATLTLYRSDKEANAGSEVEYMQSGVPESINILDPFKVDPAFRKNAPVLSAARLAKVLPTGITNKAQTRSLRNSSRPLLRLVPVLNTSARFSHIGASPSQAKVLASLDINVTPWADGHVQVRKIEVTLSEGRAENLDSCNETRFPITCELRDSLSFVYKLVPNHFRSAAASHSPVHTLFFTLNATAHPDPMHSYPLRIHWRSPVDLSALYHKPTAFLPPADPRLSTITSRSSTSNGPTSQRASTSSASFTSHLITLTVTGPPNIAVHATLRWSILVTNRSPHRTLRLAVIPITSAAAIPAETLSQAQQQAQTFNGSTGHTVRATKHKHRPTLSTSLFRAAAIPDAQTAPESYSAEASVEQYPHEKVDTANGRTAGANFEGGAGLIPLTADIRIGPLPPGACATAEMRFLVLRAGVLPVEALRIVDLDAELQRTGAPGEEQAWEEGGEVEGEGRRRKQRQWVDVGSEFLPDVVAVGE